MKNKTTVHILYVHIFLLLSPEPTRLIERQPLGAVGISQPEEIARLAPVTSDAVGARGLVRHPLRLEVVRGPRVAWEGEEVSSMEFVR